MLAHTFYPKIRLHYYYGNHQFNVSYKFGGLLSGGKAQLDNATREKIMQEQTLESFDYRIKSNPSYFSFGYSYRF